MIVTTEKTKRGRSCLLLGCCLLLLTATRLTFVKAVEENLLRGGSTGGKKETMLETTWAPLTWDDGEKSSSNWFSEENGGYSDIAKGPIFSMNCHGHYCDTKEFEYMVYEDSVDIFSDDEIWSPWFSEEQRDRDCPTGKVVRQIQCGGRYCDRMRLKCAGLKDGFRVNDVYTSTSSWFSDEHGWHYCRGGSTYWLVGLGCKGRYCDNIQLRCALIEGQGIDSSSLSIEDEPSLGVGPEDTIA